MISYQQNYDILFTNLAMEYHKRKRYFHHLNIHLMSTVYFSLKILNEKNVLSFMTLCSQICKQNS